MLLLGGRGRRGRGAVALAFMSGLAVLAAGLPANAGTDVAISASGTSADVRLPRSAVPCAEGGSGSYEQVSEALIAPGQLSQLGGTLRLALDAHADSPAAGGFLRPERSHVAISNQRGAIVLRLQAGSCSAPALNFDGTTLEGTGTWHVDPDHTTDAYRQASGLGKFSLSADFSQSGQHPWSIELDGRLTVLQPELKVELVKSFWGRLGSDYAGRIATVVYRVTNTGAGDAFRVQFLEATSTTGITAIEHFPTELDDLSAGESVDVTVRYKVGLRGKRSGPLLVARQFDTELTFRLPDALDVATTPVLPVRVSAPAFPPSL